MLIPISTKLTEDTINTLLKKKAELTGIRGNTASKKGRKEKAGNNSPTAPKPLAQTLRQRGKKGM